METRCPRCHTVLEDQDYEGQTIAFCGVCFGHWLQRAQLDEIVRTIEFKFSQSEAESLEAAMEGVGDEHRLLDESPPVACPVCETTMERKRYHEECPVMIDECAEHGVWLDTGEIKDLQIFVERTVFGYRHNL